MKLVYFIAGWFFIALGVAGIILPGLPTTPFILLAAWFFARSSDKMYNKLINHKQLGPVILNWEQHKIIPKKVKLIATFAIVTCTAISFFFSDMHHLLSLAILLLVLYALRFIWTKPHELEE